MLHDMELESHTIIIGEIATVHNPGEKMLTLLTLLTLCKSRHFLLISSGMPGACPGFLKGGGGPISLGSLKKGHQILKGGGSNGLMGGLTSLTRTTNIAYLDAKK